MEKRRENYLTPQTDVTIAAVECGFAASPQIENPGEGVEITGYEDVNAE